MYKKNTLNNIILSNKRKDPVYQAVLTDLALAGAIDIKIAEALLGYQIPDYLKLPVDFEARLKVTVEEDSSEPVDEEPASLDEGDADDEAGNQ